MLVQWYLCSKHLYTECTHMYPRRWLRTCTHLEPKEWIIKERDSITSPRGHKVFWLLYSKYPLTNGVDHRKISLLFNIWIPFSKLKSIQCQWWMLFYLCKYFKDFILLCIADGSLYCIWDRDTWHGLLTDRHTIQESLVWLKLWESILLNSHSNYPIETVFFIVK